MPVTECIAVYIRLSSEDNDVDGSIKAESNSVSAQRMLINLSLIHISEPTRRS